MAGIRIEGNTSGNVAEVNSANELLVALSANELTAGYAALTCETDAGTVTGVRLMRDLEATNDYRLRVGEDTPLFSDQFINATINSSVWACPVNVMTQTVANGFCTLNAGLNTASGSYANMYSVRCFPTIGTATLYMECTLQFSQPPQANNVCEWGFGFAATTAAVTEGAYFTLLADGSFRCIMMTNTVPIQSNSLNFNTLVGTANVNHFIVGITDDSVEYWINDVMVAMILRQPGQYAIVASNEQRLLFRTFNSGITGSAQQMKMGLVDVTLTELRFTKPWADILAGSGNMGYQTVTGVAVAAIGSTALYTNSLAAGAGTAATNTTAALGSGLGGQFSLLPTLAVPTDGIISSYQVPVASVTVLGKSLFIKGIRIVGVVTTVLVGGPIIGAWSLAFGHNTVTLATTQDTPNAVPPLKTPRRIPLGIQTWAAAAAVGVQADRDISIVFQTPICVQPGEFVQTVLKNFGTVTTSGVITFLIMFDSYWE